MRFLKALTVATLLLGYGTAQAQAVEVRDRRNPVAVVATDTLWGGLAGAAVGGGIIGYRMGIQNNPGYGWGPVLATGIGIGLGAGLVLGIIDAASGPGFGMVNGPVSDGMALREQRPADLSGQVAMPIKIGRF